MRRFLAAVAAVLALASPAAAARVRGVVVDRAGRPIELANVQAPAHRAGATTDAAGAFEIDLPDGPVALEVGQIGYQKVKVEVVAAADLAPLRIVLADAPVPVEEVVVATSTFGKAGKSEGATLRRMDVLTTPGGAADVFQSLRALPGINAPDEGAALYVRGGDPRETLVRLDGVEIGHPYHYEGASGGLFSAFDAYMLKSAFFSSGGFAAVYGGVLSGVLDIETQDAMNTRTVSVGANLVGASVSGTWALIPDRLALVGTLRGSNVTLLDRLYGSSSDFVVAPRSGDAAGRLLYRYSPTGRMALIYLGGRDRVGVSSAYLNFEGEMARRARNDFGAIQLRDVVAGSIAVRLNVAAQRYATQWRYGPMDVEERETHAQASFEAKWSASSRHEIAFGFQHRHRRDAIAGSYPSDSTDLHPGAVTRYQDASPRLDYPGVYVEDKLRVWGPLYATLGARFDHLSVPGVWTADPRGAVAWRIDDRQTVRVAAGRYHQPADPERLDPVYGNPRLRPLRADHIIAGYEWTGHESNVRLEVYRKDYKDLITQSAEHYYDQQGHGYARGADVFARTRSGPFAGWISYGFLDTRRREGDAPREVPAPYGVRHALSLVGALQLPGAWQLGARYGFASGRPYTPIAGATYDADRDVWQPIEAEENSGRMPEYHRLDLRVLRLFSLPAGLGLPASSTCVLYAEALNALGIENVLQYTYDLDYSERHETLSYFSRRTVVAGMSLTW